MGQEQIISNLSTLKPTSIEESNKVLKSKKEKRKVKIRAQA